MNRVIRLLFLFLMFADYTDDIWEVLAPASWPRCYIYSEPEMLPSSAGDREQFTAEIEDRSPTASAGVLAQGPASLAAAFGEQSPLLPSPDTLYRLMSLQR